MSTAPRLVLASAGQASDGAFLAAADLAAIAAELDVPYRLVGGNAVTLLVAVHGVTDLVPARETADADFGAEYPVISDPRLLAALLQRGYTQEAGNRFIREHTLPSADGSSDSSRAGRWRLVVDVLAPSYEGRLLTSQPHGELVVDEVPGLFLALAREGTPVTVEVTLTSGHQLSTDLMLPDVVSALCLKAFAWAGRFEDRDAVDLWRLLEAAHAAGITADAWPRGSAATSAAEILRQSFGRPGAPGLVKAASSSAPRTRIATLVRHVVGSA